MPQFPPIAVELTIQLNQEAIKAGGQGCALPNLLRHPQARAILQRNSTIREHVIPIAVAQYIVSQADQAWKDARSVTDVFYASIQQLAYEHGTAVEALMNHSEARAIISQNAKRVELAFQKAELMKQQVSTPPRSSSSASRAPAQTPIATTPFMPTQLPAAIQGQVGNQVSLTPQVPAQARLKTEAGIIAALLCEDVERKKKKNELQHFSPTVLTNYLNEQAIAKGDGNVAYALIGLLRKEEARTILKSNTIIREHVIPIAVTQYIVSPNYLKDKNVQQLCESIQISIRDRGLTIAELLKDPDARTILTANKTIKSAINILIAQELCNPQFLVSLQRKDTVGSAIELNDITVKNYGFSLADLLEDPNAKAILQKDGIVQYFIPATIARYIVSECGKYQAVSYDFIEGLAKAKGSSIVQLMNESHGHAREILLGSSIVKQAIDNRAKPAPAASKPTASSSPAPVILPQSTPATTPTTVHSALGLAHPASVTTQATPPAPITPKAQRAATLCQEAHIIGFTNAKNLMRQLNKKLQSEGSSLATLMEDAQAREILKGGIFQFNIIAPIVVAEHIYSEYRKSRERRTPQDVCPFIERSVSNRGLTINDLMNNADAKAILDKSKTIMAAIQILQNPVPGANSPYANRHLAARLSSPRATPSTTPPHMHPHPHAQPQGVQFHQVPPQSPAQKQAQWLKSKFSELPSVIPDLQLSIQDSVRLRFTFTGASNTSSARTFLLVVLNRGYGFNDISVGTNRHNQRIIEITDGGNQRLQNSTPQQIRQEISAILQAIIHSQQSQEASSSLNHQAVAVRPNLEIWNRIPEKIRTHWDELSEEMRMYVSICVVTNEETNLNQFYANLLDTTVLGDKVCPIGLTRAIQIPIHLPTRDKNSANVKVYELENVIELLVHKGKINDPHNGMRRDPEDQENWFALKELIPAPIHFQHLQQCAQAATQQHANGGSSLPNPHLRPSRP